LIAVGGAQSFLLAGWRCWHTLSAVFCDPTLSDQYPMSSRWWCTGNGQWRHLAPAHEWAWTDWRWSSPPKGDDDLL